MCSLFNTYTTFPEFRAKETEGPLRECTRISKQPKHRKIRKDLIYSSSSQTVSCTAVPSSICLRHLWLNQYCKNILSFHKDYSSPLHNHRDLMGFTSQNLKSPTGQAHCTGTFAVRPPDFSLHSPDPCYQHSHNWAGITGICFWRKRRDFPPLEKPPELDILSCRALLLRWYRIFFSLCMCIHQVSQNRNQLCSTHFKLKQLYKAWL